MVSCDVPDCPREATNELPIEVYDPGTKTLEPGTGHLCDHDFMRFHDAAIQFTLGLPSGE